MDWMSSLFKLLERFSNLSSRIIKGKNRMFGGSHKCTDSCQKQCGSRIHFLLVAFLTVFVNQYFNTDIGLCHYYI